MVKVVSYQRGMSNGYFLVDKSIVAVDTGSLEDEDSFLSACADCGIVPTDIKLIVITHGHCDHFQNLTCMKRLTDAPALCHKNAEVFLREGRWPNKVGRTWIGEDILRIEAVEGVDMDHVAKVEPDILIEDEYDLHPWGVAARVLPVHGHSEGDLAILTDDGDALIGDLYAEGPGYGKSGPAFFMGPGDAFMDAVESIEYVLSLGAHTFWSGHGGPFSRDEVEKNTATDRAEGPTAGKPAERD